MPPKRMSISSVFPGVDLPPSGHLRSRENSPARRTDLTKTLRNTFGKQWPQWDSISGGERNKFTIRMNDVYRDMANVRAVQADFQSAEHHIHKIIEAHQIKALDINDTICEWIESCMMDAVFGSNAIERAGQSYDITLDICRRIFRGQQVEAIIDERSEEYQKGVEGLKQARLAKEGQDIRELVLRSRKEVIQHAKAMEYMVMEIVHRGELLSEKLILDTHSVLCEGITSDDGSASETYAGKHRQGDVWVKHKDAKKPHRFIHPTAVSHFIKKMCERYAADVAQIEQTGILDPFALAARYSHVFVNVHPFEDGNGRMCRIILNAILLRYAGVVVPMGEEGDAAREEYIDIMNDGTKEFLDDSYEDFKDKGHEGLAGFILRKASLKFKEVLTMISRVRK